MLNHIIDNTDDKQLQLNCPSCNKTRYYSDKYKLKNAIENNTKCCECCQKGKIISDKQKENHSKMMSGKNNPNYGKFGVLHQNFGKIGPNKGKIFSEDMCEKLSRSHMGKKQSDDTKRKLSIKNGGKNNPFYGKSHSEISKNKMSCSWKKRWDNTEIRKHLRDILTKCDWIKVKCDKGQLELLDKWSKLGFNFEPNYKIKTDVDLFYIDGYDKEKNVVIEYDTKYHNKSTQKRKDLIRQNKIINILKPKKFWRYNSVNKIWRNVI